MYETVSVEVEMPLRSSKETPFVQLREQLQSDMAQILARLELVEAQLGLEKEKHRGRRELSETCDTNGSLRDEHISNEVNFLALKAGGAVTAGEQKAETDKTLEPFSEVRFEESAWSIPVVIGLVEDVGWFDKFFAAALLLLNLFMQAAFSSVLLTELQMPQL